MYTFVYVHVLYRFIKIIVAGSDPKIVNLKPKFSILNSCGLLYIIRKQEICSLIKYI